MRGRQWRDSRILKASIGLSAVALMAWTLRSASVPGGAAHATWSDYLGAPDSAQYSALSQVNKSNVGQMEQAWFYPAGNNGFRFGFNPLVVDNVMYVLGKDNAVIALDASTGREVWVHDNNKPRSVTHRGINYWESKDRSDRRLFYSTNNILHALDATTGKLIPSFGDHGDVDLREGLGREPKTIRAIQPSTPGRVFENLLILGSATGEEYGSPPGDLRAFDVLTGKLVWSFHTIPHPGEYGYDTWPKDAWKNIGGTNTWGEISLDEKRGIATSQSVHQRTISMVPTGKAPISFPIACSRLMPEPESTSGIIRLFTTTSGIMI